MSIENKFTRFGKHIAEYRTAPNNVWNYVGYDQERNTCIIIELDQHSYDCELKNLITIRHGNFFDMSDRTSLIFEEITEQEFWAAYKMAVVKQLELYYKNNPDKKTWEDRKIQLQKAV